MSAATPQAQTRARVRGRHRGRGWLIALLVLLALLVVADRASLLFAERLIATKAQSSQQLEHKPSVSIGGFPFLTQVIANHYNDVRVSGSDVTVDANGQRVRLQTFSGKLTGVRVVDHFSGVTAAHANGTATLGYDQLSRVLDVALSYAAGGRVQATKSVQVLGRSVSATVSARVTVPGGDELAFSDVRVAVADVGVSVPSAVTSELSAIFARKLSLGGLPFGLRITQLSVAPGGIQVSAAANNVRLE